MLGWLTPGAVPTYPWTGQMSIPRDISLLMTPDGIRLFQAPSSVISHSLDRLSRGRIWEKKEFHLSDKEVDLGGGGNAYWIKAELRVGTTGEAGFKIARGKDAGGNVIAETVIGYDAASHQLFVKGSKPGQHMPVQVRDGILRLQILLDKSSLEIFADNGEKVLTTMIYPDAGADGLCLYATGGPIWVKDLKIWNLAE
jgi:levanase/fructan beta-fructosidase